jgi:methionyl-tRNA formyltransferase
MMRDRVLLLTESTKWGALARNLLGALGADVRHVPWTWGEERAELDAALAEWNAGAIICFKADCIVPSSALARASLALNFHPSPPWLRGVACPERAVERGDGVYGLTCHHMVEEVDAGRIVDLETFSVVPGTTVRALRERVGAAMLLQLERVWIRRHTLTADADGRDPIWTGELLSTDEARSRGLL